ncbi:hypothetical protein DC31_06165 [Microbacterium sp. CH12i]|uniref:DUF3560 domain-containing protein n=1 Tax=Microbacterium sp. CH12i TaxID=1479651 RepID=UPI000460E068|nr:DUF3560 domain-containing protein [Microbacterium sp. CH12i]KDA04559.1 hypothetical protein DC31_06165 [Microbacterium sp. CH12i]
MITITHNHEAGTLIEGTAKGDGTAEVLKRCGWRWGRSVSTWYVPNSRDRHAKMHTINHTSAQLEASGFEISIDVDDTARTTAEVEAAKIERQQDRVAALQTKAERRGNAAEAAHQEFRHRLDQLPPMGEPVKIGHHSEGRHRAAIKHADTAFNRVHTTHEAAAHAEAAATIAATTTASRYNVRTVANRIEKIAAAIRSFQRDLDGYIAHRGSPYAEQIAPVAVRAHAEMLTYWALAAAHGLGNVLLRLLWLNVTARPVIDKAYPKSGTFPPFSESRDAWHQSAQPSSKTRERRRTPHHHLRPLPSLTPWTR